MAARDLVRGLYRARDHQAAIRVLRQQRITLRVRSASRSELVSESKRRFTTASILRDIKRDRHKLAPNKRFGRIDKNADTTRSGFVQVKGKLCITGSTRAERY